MKKWKFRLLLQLAKQRISLSSVGFQDFDIALVGDLVDGSRKEKSKIDYV